jgi:hypothetical protein
MAVLEQSRNEEEWAEERLVEQKRLADEEKGRRVREYFEMIRQRQIEEARRAAGSCVCCGRRLNVLARLFKRVRHFRCRSFSE